jgi:hypothetical protein
MHRQQQKQSKARKRGKGQGDEREPMEHHPEIQPFPQIGPKNDASRIAIWDTSRQAGKRQGKQWNDDWQQANAQHN